MGFEVLYKYHDKLDDGNYNKSETKEMSRKIGDPFEEISLETLAAKIMAQMARRDIWVLPDVEIYELKKQKVNFRETKGGVIIKNKKFLLDSENNSIIAQDIPEIQDSPPQHQNGAQPHNNLPSRTQKHQGNGSSKQKRPIKVVMLDDVGFIRDKNGPLPIMTAVKQAGLQLSKGKKYPVFKEMEDPRDKRVDENGQPSLERRKSYLIWDDLKRDVVVSQDYFIQEAHLENSVAGDSWDQVPGNDGPKLMFDDIMSDDIPDLRRK